MLAAVGVDLLPAMARRLGYAEITSRKARSADATTGAVRMEGFFDPTITQQTAGERPSPLSILSKKSTSGGLSNKSSPPEVFIQESTPISPEPKPLANIPLWRLDQFDDLSQRTREGFSASTYEERYGETAWRQQPTELPSRQPLSSLASLLNRLRIAIMELKELHTIDVAQIIMRLSHARPLDKLPFERHRRWPNRIQLIVDRSHRLVPYWWDQDVVCAALNRISSRDTFESVFIHEGFNEPVYANRHSRPRHYMTPSPGTFILVLSDLGCLDRCPHSLAFWLDLGRLLTKQHCKLVALTPCPPERWIPELLSYWTLIPWELKPSVLQDYTVILHDIEARKRRLLHLVAPSVRVEPGLLRDIRLLLDPQEVDAATETDVWQDPIVVSRSAVAATLDPSELDGLRAEFEEEPEDLRREVLKRLRQWRAKLPEELWFEEVLGLQDTSRSLVPQDDLTDIVTFFQFFGQKLLGGKEAETWKVGACQWFRRASKRLPTIIWKDQEVGKVLRQVWSRVHQDDLNLTPPPGFEPEEIPAPANATERRWMVLQCDEQLRIVPDASRIELVSEAASWLATIRSRNNWVRILPSNGGDAPRSGIQHEVLLLSEEQQNDAIPLLDLEPTQGGTAILPSTKEMVITSDCESLVFHQITCPNWASALARDVFGLWAEFKIRNQGEAVRQRFRWIPPGNFLMGSPDHEQGRYADEDPLHKVMISHGFWLGDTACTQALWQAIMGNNPSMLKGTDRPVEMVSWNDVQEFINRLNEVVTGGFFRLPTEAEWEYACRAGTRTPFWFGANINLQQVNYRGELPYADGKKGFFRKQTVDVRALPCNGWGLYQMHGNVWEWCSDWHRPYRYEAVHEPVHPEKGIYRVLRGGSYLHEDRLVRSACRDRSEPGFPRDDGVGFRLARSQAPD
jgi:formylglycine-generating enzyme required for sulfatase activity